MADNEAPAHPHVVFRQYLDAVGLHGMAGAEAAGLQATEWYALSVVSLAGRMTPGDLAARTGLTTGATTRLIDRLESAGYVRRVPDPADRRRVMVEPAAETFPAIEETVAPARRRIGELLEGYTPEQRELLFDYFARAAPAYRAAAEEIRASATPPHRRPGRKPSHR
ncbi:MarR family transcriptional regulator [Streptomyces sp. 891-h]|uniref:MarR family winged helix-turn-helix transcriptional regulator n=1 Tax=unclassified Streptomyces TaxID=2593676 RepID=UPI001FAA5B4A|nr:MarR family transcriptional regulator [Streptomyces sp. 891-h]UNZ18319.1 MarR family transcriptional regulator [Streptomyces sp. 891-h]